MAWLAKPPPPVGNQRRIGQFELDVEQAVEGVLEPDGAAGPVRHGPGPER
jgi:hypothetical protein